MIHELLWTSAGRLGLAALLFGLLVGLYHRSRRDRNDSDGRLLDAWRSGSDRSRPAAEASAGVTVRFLMAIATVAGMVLDGVRIFLENVILGLFVSKIPKLGPKVADGLINAGYKAKKRKADAIVNVIYGDGVVVPRPANWQSEQTAFKTSNGEWYYAKGIGFNPRRMNGKVPLVWALRDGAEITEPLEAPITNARKLQRFVPFQRPGGEPDVAVDIDPNGYDYGPGVGRPSEEAVADGGTVTRGVGIDRPKAPPSEAASPPEYNGTIVSFRDAYELFGSKITQEDMQDQETRGKLAVLDWNRRDQMKVLLFMLLAFLAGLFGPGLANQIGSSGGSAIQNGIDIGLWIVTGVPF